MSSIEPDDGSSEVNRTQKVDRAFVVACGNCSILLEFGEKVRVADVVLCTSLCRKHEDGCDCVWAESQQSCLVLQVAQSLVRLHHKLCPQLPCRQATQAAVGRLHPSRRPEGVTSS